MGMLQAHPFLVPLIQGTKLVLSVVVVLLFAFTKSPLQFALESATM